jgi:hypothetical protein
MEKLLKNPVSEKKNFFLLYRTLILKHALVIKRRKTRFSPDHFEGFLPPFGEW